MVALPLDLFPIGGNVVTVEGFLVVDAAPAEEVVEEDAVGG